MAPEREISPIVVTGKPSWPPETISPTLPESPLESPPFTQALNFRRDRQRSPPTNDGDVGNTSIQSVRLTNGNSSTTTSPRNQSTFSSPITRPNRTSSPGSSFSSPRIAQQGRLVMRKSVNQDKRKSGLLNTRDELLISLLASEAVVDCREFEILGSEEVDELKKVGFQTKVFFLSELTQY
jgi:hypothetical protein